MTEMLQEHIGWLKLYVYEMDENNWRDMRNHCAAQLRMLSDALAPAQEPISIQDPELLLANLLAMGPSADGSVERDLRHAIQRLKATAQTAVASAEAPLTSALREEN